MSSKQGNEKGGGGGNFLAYSTSCISQFTIDMLKTEYNKEQTIIYLTLNPQHNTACAASQVIKFIEVQKRCNPSTWEIYKGSAKRKLQNKLSKILKIQEPK